MNHIMMDNDNIIRSNKLIIEFMGLKIAESDNSFSWNDSPFYFVSHSTREKVINSMSEYVKYFNSWDWLMPVVIKIDRLSEDGIIPWTEEYMEWCDYMEEVLTTNYELESTFKCVVKIIEWYNLNYK